MKSMRMVGTSELLDAVEFDESLEGARHVKWAGILKIDSASTIEDWERECDVRLTAAARARLSSATAVLGWQPHGEAYPTYLLFPDAARARRLWQAICRTP